VNPELSRLFEEYASYHRHPANKFCHYVGIPFIVFTLVGLLWKAAPLLAAAIAIGAISYDFRLSARLTAPFAAFVLLSFALARQLPAWALWTGFVLGWSLQLLGHFAYEKRAPAFFENLRQLLVGPLWIIGTLGETRSAPAGPPASAPPAG
jgi:uncharacterized membrane protein YGL010W